MVAFAVKGMGGMIPRTESRLLPDNAAEMSLNCDLQSGALDSLPAPALVKDLTAFTTSNRAYRFPAAANGTGSDIWLPLDSQFSSVCRSPLANDTGHRLYWTNGGANFFFDTAADIAAILAGSGGTPFDVGMVYPDPTAAVISVANAGGTTDGSVPYEERSYCFTWVNTFGEESAPSLPTTPVSGPPDAVWTVSSVPITPPSNPFGKNYATINKINIYRTAVGTNTGGQFFLCYSHVFSGLGPPSITDPTTDTTITLNPQLYSAAFANPPDGLDGLTSLPGGMLVGFTGNTVHFCEPNRPHAWPAAYDQSLHFPIVALCVWQQSLVVLTQGFPSTGSGPDPSNFTFSQVRVPEPCLSRGSVITDLMGVYYASQNGLVMLNYYGMQNQTLSLFTKNIWLHDYKAASIMACRHRAQYLAIDFAGGGFIIDYSEQRLGVTRLSTFQNATAIWNDEYSGDTYIMAGHKVYLWDSPTAAKQTFRWRSKQFYGPAPVSLGACQISLDPDILTATDPGAPPLTNGDSTLTLPGGVNAIFNIYAGPGGAHLVMTRHLTQPREIFRLPSGFKSFDWQFEIVSRVGVHTVELATTMRELKGV